jgi:hypothetical protein
VQKRLESYGETPEFTWDTENQQAE